ncbi:hypothetical protein [Vulgatibacter incomptus]|uniref:Uncharacterized protein n=1 Tax=Vulgatibacter incomptus TaxID=1391653 RepID=A0A0K1PH21_9BACT|nr:hypothetical protein [Vulgatibacter incomptus]AKU92802.1 hypothetical protein AKJ08_3189 [Vulgatibacter incomptus]
MKGLFLASMLTLGGIAVAAAVALLTLTALFNTATTVVTRELESIHAMGEIRTNLLLFSREALLFAETRDAGHREARDRARRNIFDWLLVARQAASDPDEERQIDGIRDSVDAYLARRSDLRAEGRLTPIEILTLSAPAFNQALTAVSAYMYESRAEAMETQRHVDHLSRAVTDVSVVFVIILPLAILGVIASSRRGVFRPFNYLRSALFAYSSGDTKARAPRAAPSSSGRWPSPSTSSPRRSSSSGRTATAPSSRWPTTSGTRWRRSRRRWPSPSGAAAKALSAPSSWTSSSAESPPR